jgi:hypothetical protein
MKSSSLESSLAFQKFQETAKSAGDICTYDVMGAAIGKDPRAEGYAAVMSARRRFERENDCVIVTIDGTGYKRLSPQEVVTDRGPRDIRGVRRKVRQSLRRQATVIPSFSGGSLPNEVKQQALAQMSILGALNQMTKPSARKKIAEAAVAAARIIPGKEALALFAKWKRSEEVPETSSSV